MHRGEGAPSPAPAATLAGELKGQTGRGLELIFPPNTIKKLNFASRIPVLPSGNMEMGREQEHQGQRARQTRLGSKSLNSACAGPPSIHSSPCWHLRLKNGAVQSFVHLEDDTQRARVKPQQTQGLGLHRSCRSIARNKLFGRNGSTAEATVTAKERAAGINLTVIYSLLPGPRKERPGQEGGL